MTLPLNEANRNLVISNSNLLQGEEQEHEKETSLKHRTNGRTHIELGTETKTLANKLSS